MFINRLLSYFSATLSSKLITNLPYGGGGGWERVCVHKSSSKLHFCYFIQQAQYKLALWGGGWERVCVHKSSSKLHFCYFIQQAQYKLAIWGWERVCVHKSYSKLHFCYFIQQAQYKLALWGGGRGCVFINRLLSYISATLSSKLSTN